MRRPLISLMCMMIDSGCLFSCHDQLDRLAGPVEIGESPITVVPQQPIKALHKDRWVCLRLPKGTVWKYGLGVTREDGQVFELKIRAWAEAGERTFRDPVVWHETWPQPKG